MDLYRQEILDHFKHPHHFGHIPKHDVAVTLFNSACGDKITMEMKFDKKKETIVDICFSGEGCAVSIASASMLTDRMVGMDIKDARDINSACVLKSFGSTLTPSRVKCALLPLEALHKCILEQKKASVI